MEDKVKEVQARQLHRLTSDLMLELLLLVCGGEPWGADLAELLCGEDLLVGFSAYLHRPPEEPECSLNLLKLTQ